jgi:hypothetical protein
MRDTIRLTAATTACILTLAVGWWKVYVQPNDAHNDAVVACAGNDTDPRVWDACHNEKIEEAGGIVRVLHPATR